MYFKSVALVKKVIMVFKTLTEFSLNVSITRKNLKNALFYRIYIYEEYFLFIYLLKLFLKNP